MELEDYFKTPSQEEVDKGWLRQMCYDGQMADEEIEEFVNAVYDWKENQVKNNVDLYNVVNCSNCNSKDIVKEPVFRCKKCNCFHDKNGQQL